MAAPLWTMSLQRKSQMGSEKLSGRRLDQPYDEDDEDDRNENPDPDWYVHSSSLRNGESTLSPRSVREKYLT